MITLFREGRAALTTTFQAFKFIELYSMIQFFSVTMLYVIGSNLTDAQFSYIDIGVLVPLCIFQSWTGAYEKLTPNLPQASLFSPTVMFSVLGSALIQFSFLFYAFMTVRNFVSDEEWVDCSAAGFHEEVPPCTKNTTLYLLSCQQYIITCACFSISKPFRKEVYTNPLFLVCISLMAIYQTYLIFYVDDWSKDLFGLVDLPMHYKVQIGILAAADLLLSYLFEKFAISAFNKYWNERREARLQDERDQAIQKTLDRASLLLKHEHK